MARLLARGAERWIGASGTAVMHFACTSGTPFVYLRSTRRIRSR
jgi:hypothetical protein